MSPRTGRPKTEKPKIFEVKARIDEDLNNKLIEYCEKNNVLKTDVVRMGVEMILNEK